MAIPSVRRVLALFPLAAAILLIGAASSLLGICGPFTDVTDATFCPFVLEIFTLGITTGTTPTTYDPASPVSRLQMAAFLSRTVDGVLKRGSERAPLGRFWTTQNENVLALTTVAGGLPRLMRSDGADIWVAVSGGSGTVARIRASDGALLQTWTGAGDSLGVVVANGLVLVGGATNPGKLYKIDPQQPAGAVTTVASNLGANPGGMAFDGARVWTANQLIASVSIVTPGASIPWTVTTVTTGFTRPWGAVFDGSNVWVTDGVVGRLLKLDANGAILQTVTVGTSPSYPAFDGTNIWVPNGLSSSVTVVRASTGAVLQTLTGNGITTNMIAAAFDGERVLITAEIADSVSLWKAADLTPLGSFPTGANTGPYGVCSDGVNFFVGLLTAGKIARF